MILVVYAFAVTAWRSIIGNPGSSERRILQPGSVQSVAELVIALNVPERRPKRLKLSIILLVHLQIFNLRQTKKSIRKLPAEDPVLSLKLRS